MGNVVMPKNSADMDVLVPILEYYYTKESWVENADYISYIKQYLLDNGIDNKERESQHYTKRMQVLSYFGFIEWEDISNSQSKRRITNLGKKFYEAIKNDNIELINEVLIKSLDITVFGRNNYGAPSSDSDVEAPILCIRAILDLEYITKTEFAYLLYNLQDNGFTYTTVIHEINGNRQDKSKQIKLPADAEKYIDWKPITFLERLNFLEINSLGTIINDSVLKKYKYDLLNLKIYNIDKNIIENESHKVAESSLIPSSSIPFPHNRIIFGAPGTGKSYLLNENAEKYFTNENIERVTFHPNYSYAQFVGSYKPFMASDTQSDKLSGDEKRILDILTDNSKSGQEKYDLLYPFFKEENSLTRLPLLLGLYTDESFKTKKQDGTDAVNDNNVERNHGRAIRPYVNLVKNQMESEQITYQYVPGSFMRIYVAAKQNPSQNFLLIIEEINRANVAAVFGDIFQLLDRKANGESEYPVAASEDIKKYLAKNGIYEDELSIPSNMYIWATMNSADQGVFPMDTAFKRRWEFEYIGIDDNEKNVQDYEIPINSNKKVNWNELRKVINDKLIELSVNEDKLLGPFFLSKNILGNALKDTESFIKLFKSKVIMYLFEDAAKLKAKQLFKIDSNKYIFSEICKQFDEKGLDIFGIDPSIVKISDIMGTNIDDSKNNSSDFF